MNETNPNGQVAADAQQSEVALPAESVADMDVSPTLASESSVARETQSVDLASSIADTGSSGAVLGNRFVDVVSGQFDADEEIDGITPPKRVLAPMAETPKLHKVLAQAGMGSRLEMEQLIMEGRISVNNEPAHIGQRIQFGDNIKVALIHRRRVSSRITNQWARLSPMMTRKTGRPCFAGCQNCIRENGSPLAGLI